MYENVYLRIVSYKRHLVSVDC